MIVMPPALGRAVGEPPGSSRRSTQVVKEYDELQSRETLPASCPGGNDERSRDCVDEPPLCPYSEETVAGCSHYRARSEHGDFPKAADCRDMLDVPVSSYQRRRICQRAADEVDVRSLARVASVSMLGRERSDLGAARQTKLHQLR
jgi:hypothetical protein